MSRFTFNLDTFGLDLSDRSFKLAAVAEQGYGAYKLTAWNHVAVPPGIIEQGRLKQPDKAVALIEQLMSTSRGELNTDIAVACLPEAKTFFKLFKLEPQAESEATDLVARIEAELPKEIPLPIENILYDYQVLSERAGSIEVIVGAVPRDVVLEYSEMIKRAGIKPLALEIEAQAVSRALIPEERVTQSRTGGHKLEFSLDKWWRRFKPQRRLKNHDQVKNGRLSKELHGKKKPAERIPRASRPLVPPVLLVDLGAVRTSIVVHHRDTIQLTRSLEISGEELTKSIAEQQKLSETKAEQAKVICGLDATRCKGKVSALIRRWVGDLTEHLEDTIGYYLNEQSNVPSFGLVVLSGGGAGLLGLAPALEKKLGIPVRLGNPLPGAASVAGLVPRKALLGLTTAIGLAIRKDN